MELYLGLLGEWRSGGYVRQWRHLTMPRSHAMLERDLSSGSPSAPACVFVTLSDTNPHAAFLRDEANRSRRL